jgi:glycosyltransferase involved in cell wall biosynthesis
VRLSGFTPGVSVVIVTRNGRERLEPTLAHLAHQEHPDVPCELILVDNGSDDGTIDFVKRSWHDLGVPYPLRIIVESRPGTMHARTTGIHGASYRYLVFCDDDNWLAPDYLRMAVARIQVHEAIAAVGGIGVPVYASGTTIPAWFPTVVRYFGCGPQGAADGDITRTKGCLYTAGTVIDRRWLDRLYASGFQSKLTGRDGRSLVAGEDTELMYALRKLGAQLHYCSKMQFRHFIPSYRTTWAYVKRLYRAMGYSDYLLRSRRWTVVIALRDSILTPLLLVKYGLRAARSRYGKGNMDTLTVHRLLGQLSAVWASRIA